MEVISANSGEVILHYMVRVLVEKAEAKDLEGLFHVVSIWKKGDKAWNLIFNMDSGVLAP